MWTLALGKCWFHFSLPGMTFWQNTITHSIRIKSSNCNIDYNQLHKSKEDSSLRMTHFVETQPLSSNLFRENGRGSCGPSSRSLGFIHTKLHLSQAKKSSHSGGQTDEHFNFSCEKSTNQPCKLQFEEPPNFGNAQIHKKRNTKMTPFRLSLFEVEWVFWFPTSGNSRASFGKAKELVHFTFYGVEAMTPIHSQHFLYFAHEI